MRSIILVLFTTILIGSPALIFGEDKGAKLGEITVSAGRLMVPTKETGETVYTGTELTKEGISLGGVRAMSNAWSSISILPGVNFRSPDPANMASTQMGISIRGVSGSLGSMSVEGIPIYGGNPIGPRTYTLDLENFDSIALYKGAVPPELGPGAGTRGGTLQLRPSWAREDFNINFSQFFGSYQHTKTFIRLDSGKIGNLATRHSLSYSYSEEQKWRGEGKIGPRNNVNYTLVQPIGSSFEFKLWANYNDIKHHKYRTLTYQQASDLNTYQKYDYNQEFTGNPKLDWNYYDYWTLKWTNHDIFGYLTAKLTDNIKLAIKPYYREEEKQDSSGSSSISGPKNSKNPGLQVSQWTVKRYGTLIEGTWTYGHITGLFGYQHEWQQWNDNPTKNYWINPDASLTFVGWGRYTRSTEKGYRYSPYLKISGSIDKLSWQAGMKYLKLKEGYNEGYITQFDSGGLPYAVREPKLDYGGQTYDALIPTAGISYALSENTEIYSSFGRTFQQPYAYMPIINLYYNLYTKFQKMGITMKDLFNDYKPEITENLDVGLRIRTNYLELYPTLFLSSHKNLWTPVTPGWKDPDNPSQPLKDPSNNQPVSYSTFVGRAKGYGFELATNIFLSDRISFFLNPAYTKLEYKGDITQRGIVFNTDGKQVVGVPSWTLSTGIIAKYKAFELCPILRYVSGTYSNLAFTERISSYHVFDLKAAYKIGNIGNLKNIRLSIEAYNLFDKKYIVDQGYYQGAPFTIYGSLMSNF